MPLPLAAGLAIAGGAAIGGGVLKYFGDINATKASAKVAKATAKRNAGIATDTYGKIAGPEGIMTPYEAAGGAALSSIQNYANDPNNFKAEGYGGPTQFDPSSVNVMNDPGYAFRMQQGQQALDNSAAQKGALHSGAQQKALLEYGQNLGSQEYANAYKRQEDTFQGNFNRGMLTKQDLDRLTEAQRNAYLTAQGSLLNTGYGAAGQMSAAATNLGSAQMGASNMAGQAQAATAAAPWVGMSNLGGTLSSSGLDIAKMAV